MYLIEKLYPIELIFMILHLMKNMIGKHGKRGRLKFQKYHDPYLESLSIFFKSQVNPLDRSDCHGLDLNIKAVEIIHGLFFTKSSTRIEFLLAEKSLKYNNY